jgi:predicted unusual protein kinase regulating ubiquinone biosynthesis (AarF/ABC1/UbiB family)
MADPFHVDLRPSEAVGASARACRVVRIISVGLRRLLPVAVRSSWTADERRRAELLGAALHQMALDLGSTFVKFGQIMASSPSLSGEVLAEAMRGILDEGPAVAPREVRRVIESDLGRPLDQVYAAFDPVPFAAGSLAVVHRAELMDGTDVAVKVLRPNAATSVATDLGLLGPFARWLARQFPVAVIPTVAGAVDALAEQMAEELDLRNEARAMTWFSDMAVAIGARDVFAPRPILEASGRDVLTMEYVAGSTIDDLEQIAHADIDARSAVESLIEAWFALTLCTGVFHGDMHAGNLLLTPDGRVALLDWGIVGRLPDASRFVFRRSLEGALGDETAWLDVRDHTMSVLDKGAMEAIGITEDDVLAMVRAQTLALMTQPFNEIDVMTIMPSAGGPADPSIHAGSPTTIPGWIRLVRAERRRLRSDPDAAPVQSAPPRGDMLLMKQLIFFERYGKMFLGDKPLIFDADVYRALLARPDVE